MRKLIAHIIILNIVWGSLAERAWHWARTVVWGS